jgi:undecaprenyl-diphosphatase
VYKLFKARNELTMDDLSLIGIGSLVSFVVAVVVVKAFVSVVTRYGFGPFAYYRIAAGIAALAWLSYR